MKPTIVTAFLIPVLVTGARLPGRDDGHGLPYGLETNRVAVGWLPSDGNKSEGVSSPRYTMREINDKLGGATSSTYGMYSHITSQNYTGYEFFEEFDDVVNSGALFVASVMPVLEAGFTAITSDVASQIAAVVQNFTDKGVFVWLRYGFEMNWYVNPAAEPRYYGTPAEFVASFQRVAEAVAENPMVSMFWSPNNLGGDPASSLDEWYPGDDVVDLVGIDCYPQSFNQTFEWCYNDFYERFSAGKNKSFAIGETGASGDLKEQWFRELLAQSEQDYPRYISMAWFEYNKSVDYRVVMGNDTILEETKKILGLS